MSSNDKKLEGLRISNEESNRITKESIQTALIYLLSKRNIEQITVTELVNKAGVSRAAFYRNYNSTKDVLFDFAKNVLDLIAASLTSNEYINNIYEWYLFLFSQIKKNSKIFALLLNGKLDFTPYIVKLKLDNENLNQYKLLALGKGLLAIIDKWINSGMNETPQEMSKLCVEIFVQTDILLKENEAL